jgi:hypothetical protein
MYWISSKLLPSPLAGRRSRSRGEGGGEGKSTERLTQESFRFYIQFAPNQLLVETKREGCVRVKSIAARH